LERSIPMVQEVPVDLDDLIFGPEDGGPSER